MLNARDQHLVQKIIDACATLTLREQFVNLLVRPLRELIPHKMSACGLCNANSEGVRFVLNVDFPDDYLNRVITEREGVSSPVVAMWRNQNGPYFANSHALRSLARSPLAPNDEWLETIRRHDIRNICVHGVRGLGGGPSSYFALGNLTGPFGSREAALLPMIIPHMHIGLSRLSDMPFGGGLLLADAASDTQRPLTPPGEPIVPKKALQISPREIEVLKWIYCGKNNIEISLILEISEFTVKNHVKNILEKLAAFNRTHALVKAIEHGLIDVEAPSAHWPAQSDLRKKHPN